jgi:hypothetical protein
MSGLPVELTKISASVSAAAESSSRTARPPNSAASFSARSTERLATSTVLAPRLARCFTQASPILPAPKIITVFALKSRSKTFSASSTATLPTEVAPRPMAVFVRMDFTTATRSETAGSFFCRSTRILGQLIGIFDLAGDFRFADAPCESNPLATANRCFAAAAPSLT